MIVYKYNDEYIYIEPIEIVEGEEIPKKSTEIRPPDGLYSAKFTGTKWVESATIEEIKEKTKPKITVTQEMQLAIAELAELILQEGDHGKNIL